MTRGSNLGFAAAATLALAIGATLLGPGTNYDAVAATSAVDVPKLLNGPVVFRLPRSKFDDARRYAIAFRLDRDPVGELDKNTDPDVGSRFPQSRGEYAIGSADASVAVLRLRTPKSRHCFVAYAQDVVPDGNESAVRTLDRLRVGRRVAIALQPAVPNGVPGGVTAGPTTYSRRRVLRKAASISLRASGDQRVLRQIHCGH